MRASTQQWYLYMPAEFAGVAHWQPAFFDSPLYMNSNSKLKKYTISSNFPIHSHYGDI